MNYNCNWKTKGCVTSPSPLVHFIGQLTAPVTSPRLVTCLFTSCEKSSSTSARDARLRSVLVLYTRGLRIKVTNDKLVTDTTIWPMTCIMSDGGLSQPFDLNLNFRSLTSTLKSLILMRFFLPSMLKWPNLDKHYLPAFSTTSASSHSVLRRLDTIE